MPKVTIELNEEENKAAIKMSTKIGISKQKYVKREWRHGMIRKGLVKQTALDREMGLTK